MASKSEKDLEAMIAEWRACARERPLRILVCGKTGAGKSTLINNLLNKPGLCPEGDGPGATTKCVEKVESMVNGFKLEIYDTPGLEDIDPSRSERSIVADISAAVEVHSEGGIDLFIYCMPIGVGSQRIKKEDTRILKLLTSSFGHKFWEHGIVVFTMANMIPSRGMPKTNYWKKIGEYERRIKSILIDEVKVEKAIVDRVPFNTAGDNEPVIPCEAGGDTTSGQNWQIWLLTAAIRRANPTLTPALVELRFDTILSHDLVGIVDGVIKLAFDGILMEQFQLWNEKRKK